MSNLPVAANYELVFDDAFRRYLEAIQRFPMLSAEEEKALAVRYQEKGDIEAAKKLILSHLRLVARIAREYLGYGLPLPDLLQEGTIGLMKAVHRFDPYHGVRLVSFAVHWIRAEIHEFIIRNWRMVKIATTKAHRKLFFKLRGLKKSSHALSATEMREVAEQLGVRTKDVALMEARFLSPEIALDSGDHDQEEDAAPIAFIADHNKGPFEALADAEDETRQKWALKEALLALDERSREIVAARWLQENGATLEELAARYGVSAERIRQIEKSAFKAIKARMTQALAEPQLV